MNDIMSIVDSGFEEFFEGAEKVLEMWFDLPGIGLRSVSRANWDKILDVIGAKIMSSVSTDSLDSYVLSESSLFVWSNRCVIKTCGITNLLSSFPLISKILHSYFADFSIQKLFYSHKSFMKPSFQLFPHQSRKQEEEFLLSYFPSGSWNSFSNPTDELSEWSIFSYSRVTLGSVSQVCSPMPDVTTEILMYGLPEECFKKFCRETYDIPDYSMRIDTKIDQLLPGFLLDDQAFDPYGYSVNGVQGDRYFTIHVTPQDSCSYASFETNISSSELSKVIIRALDIFKPAHFCLAVVYNADIQKIAESMVSSLQQQFDFKTIETRNINSHTTCYAWL